MLKVTVSGVYYTQGQQGKENTPYEFTKEIPEIPENWILALVKARFLPIWIAEERKKNQKNWKPFDGVKSCYLANYEKTETPDKLVGKNVFEMDETELQNVAAKYLLTEVPVPYTVPLNELRNLVALNYLKVIKGVKVDKNEDKEKLAFYKRNSVGEWILDFSGESLILESIEHKEESFEKPIVKQSLSDILNTNSSKAQPKQSVELTEEELAALEG
ncbi:MAG: hypothetical protein WAP54_07210 [Bacteroidales bacterium]